MLVQDSIFMRETSCPCVMSCLPILSVKIFRYWISMQNSVISTLCCKLDWITTDKYYFLVNEALVILDETLDLQKKLGLPKAVTLLNRSKVLSLNGNHEESCRTGRKALQETKLAIDSLGYFDLLDDKCLELHKNLVLCYYNIGVEESSLGNPDVAVLNFEEAYKTSQDNFGEEDVLT